MPNLEGRVLKGQYHIEAPIGRGGMAEVYKAWDLRRQHHVAIKVMREDMAGDREFVRRFQREAEALSALSHDNIMRFHSFERIGPLAFIVMDYVQGTTLRRRIDDADGPLPLAEVLPIVQQVCAALHYAHSENVLHRDVKPGNIMLRTDGRVLVADSATVTTVMPGTPAYMSPEQCRSEPLDVRADVYSLGIVVYEMLAGRRPFVGEMAPFTGSPREEIRWEQIHADPPPLARFNHGVPRGVEVAVRLALAKERDARWPTVQDFWEIMVEGAGAPERDWITAPVRVYQKPEAEASYLLVSAPPVPAPQPVPTSTRRVEPTGATPAAAHQPHRRPKIPPWIWALAGVVLTGLILVIGGVLSGGDRPTPEPTVFVEREPTKSAGETLESALTVSVTPQPGPTRAPLPTLEPNVILAPTPRPSLGDTWTRPADGTVRVFVPGGEFEMGSYGGEVDAGLRMCNEYYGQCERTWFTDEQPAHWVTLGDFWIDRTEVTNAQYRRCVDAGTCRPPQAIGSSTRDSYYGNGAYDDFPVIWVSWQQAAAYCSWVGGRLPTEAEWEYAARGPERLVFPWGNSFDGTRLNYCDAQCAAAFADNAVDDGYADTASVGRFQDGTSWCGALDLAGNVWEWVADWYDEDYYDRSSTHDPTGPVTGQQRVLRGGSWLTGSASVRGANRWWHPDAAHDFTGFRCVSDLE